MALSCVTYADFSSTSDLVLVGDAASVSGALQLTPNVDHKVGAAWFAPTFRLAAGFTSDFHLRMGPADVGSFGDGDGPGADGLAFVVQAYGPSSTGTTGGGIGYQGIPSSLAIEFDTYMNSVGDGSADSLIPVGPGNHVAIHSRGTLANDTGAPGQLDAKGLADRMNDGASHHARIEYDGVTLKVFFDSVELLSYDVDVATLLDASIAYAGFTAATGQGYQVHEILDWTFCRDALLGVYPLPYGVPLGNNPY